MNLTAEKIDYLHSFVKRKYVDYYDVQLELVDHLATAIETKITEHPKLDFYTALQQVYDGFGIFGFANFVSEKAEQVLNRFRKMHNREFIRFFTLPKILFTAALTFCIYWFNATVSFETSRIATLVVLISILVLQSGVSFYNKRNFKKKLVAEQSGMSSISTYNLLSQFFGSIAYDTLYRNNIWWVTIILVALIIGNIAHYMASRKEITEQRRLYPEAFAV